MIHNVKIVPLKQINDERGKIMHMLKATDDHFTKFGEIYFSCAWPGTIKAWHIHKKMTLNYVAAFGKIKLVLYDDRQNSKTNGKIQEIFLSNDDHFLVIIPPMIWNGFTSADDNIAVLANCSDIPHDKSENLRMDFNDPKFPYNWSK